MMDPLREGFGLRVEETFGQPVSSRGSNGRPAVPHGLVKTWVVVYATLAGMALLSVSLHAAARSQYGGRRITVQNDFSFPLRVEIGDYIAPNVPPGVKVGFVPPVGDSLVIRAYRPETGKLVYMCDFGNPMLRDKLDIEIP